MLDRMHIIGALCLIWCTVAVLAEVKVPMQYGIPGYNIGEQPLAKETKLPSLSRKLRSWKLQKSNQELVAVYNAASEALKGTTVDGIQSTSTVPQKDRVINYIEWGSNNGEWTAGKMREARAAGQAARCFTFEPLPRYKENHENLVREFNCTFHPTVVWTHERDFTFSVGIGSGAGSSVLNDSRIDPGVNETVNIRSIEGAAWMMQHFKPTDFIYMRIDIEGAEYSVIRDIILKGTACWVDIMELEFHSIHHNQNYHKRPADVVFPWMLRSCGVDVRAEAYYPDTFWKPDDTTCRQCNQLQGEMRDDVGA